MASLGTLAVNLSANSGKFRKGIGDAENRLKKFSQSAKRAVAGVGALAAGYLSARAVGGAIESARTQIQAEQKLQAVLASTGGAAGLTAEQIKAYAGELQSMTNFGDEATINAAAMLATFKEIKGGAFKDTLAIAQDMSAVLGTDLKGSVIQLGKALNDPAKGLSALSRSGVSFTEAQKQQIKALQESGDLLGAQKIILSELQSEFGGAAAAMADPWTQLKNAVGDLGEVFGQIGITVLGKIAPAIIGAVNGIISRMGGMEGIAAIVTNAISQVAPVFTTLKDIGAAVFSALISVVTSFHSTFMAGFSSAAGGVISFSGGVDGLATNFAAFGEMAVSAINSFVPYLQKAGEILGGFHALVIQTGAAIISEVGPPMIDAFSAVAGFISDAATMLKGWVISIVQAGASLIGMGDVTGYLNEAFSSVGSTVSTVTNFIKDAFTVVRNAIAQAITFAVGIATVAFENFGDIASYTANSIALFFVSSFEDIKHMLTVVLPAAAAWLWDNIGNLFKDGVNFAWTVFSNMLTNLKNAWTALWDWISGDSDSFDFEWKGLTDGFIAETKKFPDIAEREMTALEKTLSANAEKSSKAIGDSYRRNVTEPLEELNRMQAEAGLPSTSIGEAPKAAAAPKAPKAPEVKEVVLKEPKVKVDKPNEVAGPQLSDDEINKQALKIAKEDEKAGKRRADGGTFGSAKAAETILNASKQTPMIAQQKVTNKMLAKIQLTLQKQREESAVQGAVA
tara:strand:+ start:9243 stop:11456 length:2214 start_codon:yes stop_codon:yes gene_type:complete